MIRTDDFDKVEVASSDALLAWMDENHAREASIWLVTWKKSTPEKYLSREAVLDALIAYGWIDGIRRKLDDDRTMQLISPRKVQHWSKSYKDRAKRLIAEGRMQPPGHASIAAGKESGLWDFLEDVDALIVPDDLRAALAKCHGAEVYFDTCPDAYRRNLLRWLKLAKTQATRSKRIAHIVEASASEKRIPQM